MGQLVSGHTGSVSRSTESALKIEATVKSSSSIGSFLLRKFLFFSFLHIAPFQFNHSSSRLFLAKGELNDASSLNWTSLVRMSIFGNSFSADFNFVSLTYSNLMFCFCYSSSTSSFSSCFSCDTLFSAMASHEIPLEYNETHATVNKKCSFSIMRDSEQPQSIRVIYKNST